MALQTEASVSAPAVRLSHHQESTSTACSRHSAGGEDCETRQEKECRMVQGFSMGILRCFHTHTGHPSAALFLKHPREKTRRVQRLQAASSLSASSLTGDMPTRSGVVSAPTREAGTQATVGSTLRTPLLPFSHQFAQKLRERSCLEHAVLLILDVVRRHEHAVLLNVGKLDGPDRLVRWACGWQHATRASSAHYRVCRAAHWLE